MVMTRCQELVFLSGTGGSKREERRWKMITGVGGHPLAEQMKMLCERQKVRSDRRLTVSEAIAVEDPRARHMKFSGYAKVP